MRLERCTRACVVVLRQRCMNKRISSLLGCAVFGEISNVIVLAPVTHWLSLDRLHCMTSPPPPTHVQDLLVALLFARVRAVQSWARTLGKEDRDMRPTVIVSTLKFGIHCHAKK